jgi:DUF3071 family protein
MREARFIGLTADGEALVVELAGEHVRIAADGELRKALSGDGQMRMPLEARVTPREVQHRIRCGQTAVEIAAATGVAVELIARFEGPVLDERRHHAEQAQLAEVDGMTLAERAEDLAGGDVSWDSWLEEDDRWRVRVRLGEHRTATWAWDPRTRRLRALDDVARIIQTGGAAADALDAVLRPVATAPRVIPVAAAETVPIAEEPAEAAIEPDDDPAGPEEEAVEASPPPAPPVADRPKRRASVPSWDDIMLGTSRRPPATDAGATESE